MQESEHQVSTRLTPSQLFTLRVWEEHVSSEHYELRMQITHIRTNETKHFRDWPALVAFVSAHLSDPTHS